MDTNTALLIVVVVVAAAIIAIAYVYLQKRRSQELRSRFGPEYDRVLQEEGSKRHAEALLEKRAQRVERLNIRSLSAAECERFKREWQEEQARFVDDPQQAVANADILVRDLMRARGYPVADFEQRMEDISVDHPVVVRNYRIAHEIALRDQRGEADTEALRRALMHYRELFVELLEERAPERMEMRK